jgi:PAS domain S-box-containing protein
MGMKSEKIRVLLIEDDEDDYILTRGLLAEVKSGNYELDWAASYEEGLRVARQLEHQVCLVDYRLGERSGVQLIREARASGLTTPMILLTGQGNHDVDVEAIEAGASDYLIKDETHALRLERTIRYAVQLNTERRQSELVRLQGAALESADNAILITSQDGTITWVNSAFTSLTGYTSVEVLGQNPRILKSGQHDAVFYKSMWETLSSGSVWRGEMINLRKDGTTFVEEQTITPVLSETGKITNFIAIKKDITARKLIEAELEQARDTALESVRLKSEFLANMSHEIRTPMNGVIGMTELLLETDLSSRQRKYTETIQSSSEALLIIIDDILDFSKIEAGRLRFEKIDFELHGPFEAAVELLAERAQAKGLEITSLIDHGVPASLRGDPGRLRQVLTNLIGNAVKFTESGEVVVRVSTVDETRIEATLLFEIKDSGIGIAPEAQGGLFHAFTQADGSTTRKYGGTGLGLAISSQLVALMGGEIGLTSSVGAGSTFWFTARFEKQVTRVQTANEIPGKLSAARVLLVDNIPANRIGLKKLISSCGVSVTEAESAARALELLRAAVAENRPYDVAALDLMLTTEMDGFELAAAIKSDPTIAPVALILLPSFGRRGDGERALLVGITAYLPQPVRESQLRSCLTALIDGTFKGGDAPARLMTRHSLKESGVRNKDETPSDLRILIAEDNLVNQKVVLGQLANLGYSAMAVSNGRELLEELARAPADTILMDCQMPEMDGFEATAEIRRQEGTTRHTIIVAMTANALAGDREKCLAAGMDAYLAKPVKSKSLKLIFETVLAHGDLPAVPSTSSVTTRAAAADDPAIVDVLCLADIGSTPEKLKHIIGLYLRHTAERLDELGRAVKEESANDIYAIAHKCLGSSRSCGMTAIVPALAELQRMGKAGDLNGASHQFQAAEAAFQKLTPFLEHYIEQLPNAGGNMYA